jgi:hypothetical protein
MSGDKAHSEVRIASDDYRRGWDEAFASPWRMCDLCGMTREKTLKINHRDADGALVFGERWKTICEKCAAR